MAAERHRRTRSGTSKFGKTSHESVEKLPIGRDLHAASLLAMNSPLTENMPFPLSLREILAVRGIESSYDRDRKNAVQRRLEMFKAERTTPIAGIEVTYLELDPSLWEQFAAA